MPPEDIIKGRIVFDMKGVSKAANGLGEGPVRAAAAVPKTGKNISSMTKGIGKMAAGFAAGMAVWSGIKSLMGKLVASSPQLQASFDILKKSFEFMLRPIGDAIGGALRPFALAWLRFGLKWYKDVGPKMEKWFTSLIDNTGEFAKTFFGEEGLLGGDLGQVLADLFTDAIPEAFIETWEQLKVTLSALWKFLSVDLLPVWQILGAVIGTVIIFALKNFNFVLKALVRTFEFIGPIIGEVAGAIADLLTPVFEALPGIIDTVFTSLDKFSAGVFEVFTVKIPAAWEELKTNVTTTVDTIKTTVSEIWKGIKTTVSDTIDDIASVVKAGWDLIMSTIQTVVDGIISAVRSIPIVGKAIAGEAPGSVEQDFIMRGNKVTRFSPQDNLVGFKGDSPQLGGTTTKIEINISALDASSIDDNVIQKITDAIDSAQRRGILSRTMQAAGS